MAESAEEEGKLVTVVEPQLDTDGGGESLWDRQIPEGIQPKPAAPEKQADDEPAKPKGKEWDADRQKRDEEKAAQHRQEIAGLQAQTNQALEMARQAQQTNERLLAMLDKKPSTETREAVQQQQDLIDQLDENAEPAQIIAGMKLLKQNLIANAQTLAAENKALKDQLEAEQQRGNRRDETDQQRQARENLDAEFAKCEKDFGPGFRNEAKRLTREYFEAETYDGVHHYDAEHSPSVAASKLAIRHFYKELADKKKAEPKVPTADDTARGTTIGRGIKPGSLKEVLAQQKAKDKAGVKF